MNLRELRIGAAQLLSTGPADALASYFALEHDERRTKLFVKEDSGGFTTAFVAVCQTGIDLFRPLVVMRGQGEPLRDALRDALIPRRQYLLSAPASLRGDIVKVCNLSGDTVSTIFALNPADFKPVVNIMVQTSQTPDHQMRASIRARDGSNAAESGTSWISSKYAEVYVSVVEAVRGRGLGKSVVSAVSNSVLDRSKVPVYVTRPDNRASIRLANALGYHDVGASELTGAISII